MDIPSSRGGRAARSGPELLAAGLGRLSDALPGAMGVLGVLLILLGTSRYGVGLSADSASYIAAARSLIAGQGYLNYTGSPIFEFAPLYPTLIATGTLIWPDPIAVARHINALSFGLIVFLSSRWLARNSISPGAVLIGSLLVLLSPPLISVSVFAWTECVFTLFTLLFLLQMERYRDSGKDLDVVLCAAFAALAFLTRYIGFTLILTGAALLLLHRHASWRRRLGHTSIFVLLSIAPAAPWLFRNLLSSSTLTGIRLPGPATSLALTYATIDKITTWWLPETLPFAARVGLTALVAALVIGATVVALRRNQAGFVTRRIGMCAPMLLFVGVYVSSLVLLLANIAVDPLDNRFLSPIYVPFVLALTVLVAAACKVAGLSSIDKTVKSFATMGLALWLLYPASQAVGLVHTYLEQGAGGFSRTRWATSELIHYLALNRLDGIIYNNEPHALYLGTGQVARRSPRKYGYASRLPTNDLVAFEKSFQENRPVYLVWFDGAGGDHSYRLDEIRARFDMEPVVERADGAVYLVRGKKEP